MSEDFPVLFLKAAMQIDNDLIIILEKQNYILQKPK